MHARMHAPLAQQQTHRLHAVLLRFSDSLMWSDVSHNALCQVMDQSQPHAPSNFFFETSLSQKQGMCMHVHVMN